MDISNKIDHMELAYAQFLLDSNTKKFVWGEHDCVLFTAEGVRIRTGKSVIGIEITWKTALEARRVINELGGLRAAVTARLGEPVGVMGARIGDVALVRDVDNNDNELLGLFHDQIVLCPSMDGLAKLPLSAAICRWKVR